MKNLTQEELLNTGKYWNFLDQKRALYNEGKLYEQNDYNNPSPILDNFKGFTKEELKECFKILANRKNRTYRLKERLFYWTWLRRETTESYFLTFTFDDKTLANTSEDTRRQKVRRILQPFCLDYLGNIDFGSKNEREHYHFIVVVEKGINPLSELKKNYKYGIFKLEKIKLKKDDITKVSRYINKLTNHSIKNANKKLISKQNSKYQDFCEMRQKVNVWNKTSFWNCFPENEENLFKLCELVDECEREYIYLSKGVMLSLSGYEFQSEIGEYIEFFEE